MRSPSRAETGTVSAELAVALPAVLLVLAACLGGLRLGAEQVLLADAAGVTARSLARHDPPGTTASLVGARGAAIVGVTRRTGILCAGVERSVPLLGTLAVVPIRARSCALEELAP